MADLDNFCRTARSAGIAQEVIGRKCRGQQHEDNASSDNGVPFEDTDEGWAEIAVLALLPLPNSVESSWTAVLAVEESLPEPVSRRRRFKSVRMSDADW